MKTKNEKIPINPGRKMGAQMFTESLSPVSDIPGYIPVATPWLHHLLLGFLVHNSCCGDADHALE
jgi:hypothetical protein